MKVQIAAIFVIMLLCGCHKNKDNSQPTLANSSTPTMINGVFSYHLVENGSAINTATSSAIDPFCWFYSPATNAALTATTVQTNITIGQTSRNFSGNVITLTAADLSAVPTSTSCYVNITLSSNESIQVFDNRNYKCSGIFTYEKTGITVTP